MDSEMSYSTSSSGHPAAPAVAGSGSSPDGSSGSITSGSWALLATAPQSLQETIGTTVQSLSNELEGLAPTGAGPSGVTTAGPTAIEDTPSRPALMPPLPGPGPSAASSAGQVVLTTTQVVKHQEISTPRSGRSLSGFAKRSGSRGRVAAIDPEAKALRLKLAKSHEELAGMSTQMRQMQQMLSQERANTSALEDEANQSNRLAHEWVAKTVMIAREAENREAIWQAAQAEQTARVNQTYAGLCQEIEAYRSSQAQLEVAQDQLQGVADSESDANTRLCLLEAASSQMTAIADQRVLQVQQLEQFSEAIMKQMQHHEAHAQAAENSSQDQAYRADVLRLELEKRDKSATELVGNLEAHVAQARERQQVMAERLERTTTELGSAEAMAQSLQQTL